MFAQWRGRRDRRRAVRTLRDVALFEGCSASQLETVDRLLTEIRVDAGRVLTRQGEVGGDFVVVADGSAAVERDGRLVATLGPGSFFGEVALIGDGVRTATVTARTPMRLYVLSRFEFGRLLDAAPVVRRRVEEAALARAA